jgi:hypothetical protein
MMLITIISLTWLIRADSENLNNYCIQFFTFMSMYRLPIALNVNYIKKFLNIGNMTIINNMIQSGTNEMLKNSAAETIKMTLFD